MTPIERAEARVVRAAMRRHRYWCSPAPCSGSAEEWKAKHDELEEAEDNACAALERIRKGGKKR